MLTLPWPDMLILVDLCRFVRLSNEISKVWPSSLTWGCCANVAVARYVDSGRFVLIFWFSNEISKIWPSSLTWGCCANVAVARYVDSGRFVLICLV